MPHIVIHLSGQPDAALARRAADEVAGLTQRLLGKEPNVIAIAVQFSRRRSSLRLDGDVS